LEIIGKVEKITYVSPDQRFMVIKVRDNQSAQLITAIGQLSGVPIGELIKLVGNWENHPKYGLRFKVEEYFLQYPNLPQEIQKYLASGIIKGVGPATAKKIVEVFGENTLDVMEENPDELLKVSGITPKKLERIKESFQIQRGLKHLIFFLNSHDLPSSLGFRLYKQYGTAALALLKEDPYRLALEVPGIGFLKADGIAKALGYSKDSISRLKAGIIYTLSIKTEEGHSFYPREMLLKESSQLLEADPLKTEHALNKLLEEEGIVEKEIKETGRVIYLKNLYISESYVAKRIALMLDVDRIKSLPFSQPLKPLEASYLNEEQLEAVRFAFSKRIFLITGGPGTGKTTVLKTIVRLLNSVGQRVVLTAPTGRAAKRMGEVSGEEAKTIHRLLGWNPETSSFIHNERNPLKADVIIIDEASMMDITLFAHLLRALPQGTRLILVGDKDQLPPVGPGNPFTDLIDNQMVPAVRLTKVYRQEEGLLLLNTHRINQGLFPIIRQRHGGDFLFFHEEDPQKAYQFILELAIKRIPNEYGLDPVDSLQVLSPMKKGILGTENITLGLQNLLNPKRGDGNKDKLDIRLGDKVMQIRNNYEKDVYNGDIGRVKEINLDEGVALISFYGRDIPYNFTELDELTLAYCISVHKSQGSEYPAVILTLSTHHYPLLQRNLVYTAITRAKKLAIIVGTRKAIAMAIKNDKPIKRFSGLNSWLNAVE